MKNGWRFCGLTYLCPVYVLQYISLAVSPSPFVCSPKSLNIGETAQIANSECRRLCILEQIWVTTGNWMDCKNSVLQSSSHSHAQPTFSISSLSPSPRSFSIVQFLFFVPPPWAIGLLHCPEHGYLDGYNSVGVDKLWI